MGKVKRAKKNRTPTPYALPKICGMFACPVGERQLLSADHLFHRGQFLRTFSATYERCERQQRVDQEDWQTCLLHSLARNIIGDGNVLDGFADGV